MPPMKTTQLKKLVTKTFQIKDRKFYYHYKKVWSVKKNFKTILDDLDKNGYEVRTDPFPIIGNDIPNTVIAVSKAMLESASKYWSVLCFDVTYNLVR